MRNRKGYLDWGGERSCINAFWPRQKLLERKEVSKANGEKNPMATLESKSECRERETEKERRRELRALQI